MADAWNLRETRDDRDYIDARSSDVIDVEPEVFATRRGTRSFAE